MNVRNSVNRISINPETPKSERFDSAVIETEKGDVFMFLCEQYVGADDKYCATIYKTAVTPGQDDEPIERLISLTEPVWAINFEAANPMFKSGILSSILSILVDDDADTWENLKENFGCLDEQLQFHGSNRQIGIC